MFIKIYEVIILSLISTGLMSFVFCNENHLKNDRCNTLHGISEEDQQYLNFLFRFLITHSESGYTICGDKPLSITWLKKDLLKEYEFKARYLIPFFELEDNYILEKSMLVWERNKFFFSNKKYAINYLPEDKLILVINKAACLQVIRENLDIFNSALKKKSPEEILNEICYQSDGVSLLTSRESLLGILLGFGRNNSLAFERRDAIGVLLQKSFLLKKPPFYFSELSNLSEDDRDNLSSSLWGKMNFQPEVKFETLNQLIAEWKSISEKLDYFPAEKWEIETDLSFIHLLGFIIYNDINNQSEINDLIIKYRLTKDKICNHFRGKSFLEGMLEAFSED